MVNIFCHIEGIFFLRSKNILGKKFLSLKIFLDLKNFFLNLKHFFWPENVLDLKKLFDLKKCLDNNLKNFFDQKKNEYSNTYWITSILQLK